MTYSVGEKTLEDHLIIEWMGLRVSEIGAFMAWVG